MSQVPPRPSSGRRGLREHVIACARAHCIEERALYRTYDRIALSDAHAVAQVVQRVDIRLAAFPHGHVLDEEALVTPCAQRLHVELLVFGRDEERRGAVREGQPAVAVGQVLERHRAIVAAVLACGLAALLLLNGAGEATGGGDACGGACGGRSGRVDGREVA